MRKTATVVLAFALITGFGAAHPFDMDMLNQENTEHLEEEANIYSDQVPEFLNSLIGDQVINVQVESENSTAEVGVKMNGTRVQEIRMEAFENATLEAETTEKQIRNITKAEQPIQTLNRKLENGEISYTSNGAVNSLRTYIAEQLLSLAAVL